MRVLKSTVLVCAKFALAGAVICAIGWLLVVYQPDGTVRDSQADILDTTFVHLSNSARFARGLSQLGHDEPQSYSINGNVVSFSVNHSRKRPRQLVKEYQEEFVRQGINHKVWEASNNLAGDGALEQEALTGGVVPVLVNDNYAMLGGVLPANDAKSAEELKALTRFTRESTKKRLFKGYHAINMHWNPKKLRSTITASWSDEDFQYSKMKPGAQPSQNARTDGLDVDTEVPACPGCERLSRVRGLDPQRKYSSNVFASTRDTPQMLDFYREAMRRRGWLETDASRVFRAARPYLEFPGDEASMVEFSKNGQFLTVLGYPGDDGRTLVNTTISD